MIKPTEVRPDGTRVWKNEGGQYHREDGPAIEHANGKNYFFRHGKQYPSLEDFPKGPIWKTDLLQSNIWIGSIEYLGHIDKVDFYIQDTGSRYFIHKIWGDCPRPPVSWGPAKRENPHDYASWHRARGVLPSFGFSKGVELALEQGYKKY